MQSGKEENYWPGFVDALSNVVLTLVFVLVVFVFALSMSANKVEKRMQEIIQAEAAFKAKVEAHNIADSAKAVGDSEQSAIITEEKNVEIQTEAKEAVKTNRGAVKMERKADKIVLSYPPSVVDMDDKSAATLDQAMEATKQKAGSYTILVRSVTGNESYSVAQRLAYYRALSMRNYLITRGVGSSETIQTKLVQATQPGIGYVEVIFQAKR